MDQNIEQASVAVWTQRRVLTGLLFLALVACGGGGSSGGDGPAGDYFPLDPGGQWIYRDNTGLKHRLKVTGNRQVGSETATVLSSGGLGSQQQDEVLLVKTGSEVRELLAAADDPMLAALGSVTLLRLPLTPGTSFVQINRSFPTEFDIDGDGLSDPVTIRSDLSVGDAESITTEAGVFLGALPVRTDFVLSAHLSSRQALATSTTIQHEWYAPNVGLVRSQQQVRSGVGVVTTSRRDLIAYHVGGRRSESIAPRIVSSDPAPGSSVQSQQQFTIDFSEPMDPDTINASNIQVVGPSGPLPLGVAYDGSLRATLSVPFIVGSDLYRIQLSPGVVDLAGNSIAPHDISFTIDNVGPQLVATSPAAGAQDVSPSTDLVFEFDEELAGGSVDASDFVIVEDSLVRTELVGLEMPNDRTVRLILQTPLKAGSRVTVSLSGYLADRLGNVVRQGELMTFHVSPAPSATPPVASRPLIGLRRTLNAITPP